MCRKFLHSLTINQTQQKPHILQHYLFYVAFLLKIIKIQQKPHILQHYLFYVAFLFVYLQNKFINHERRRKKTI